MTATAWGRLGTELTRPGFLPALAAAIFAVLADSAPTGLRWWDALLRVGFGVLIVVLSTRAGATTRLGSVGVAAILAGGVPQVLAVVALVLVFLGIVRRREGPLTGPLAGALSVPALLSLGPFGFFGAPSLVAAVLVGALAMSAWRRLDTAEQRRARTTMIVAGSLAAGVAMITLTGLATVQDEARAGARAARNGLDATRDGEQPLAVGYLTRAEDRFDTMSRRLGAFWMQPGRLIPVLGQHLDSAQRLADVGDELARAAVRSTLAADTDQLRAEEGKVDVERLASMVEPLEDLVAAIDSGVRVIDDIDSPWLVPALIDRSTELRRELADVRPETETALSAARIVPDILGRTEIRRYLAIFATPAESRELGGIVSNVIEIEVFDGELEITGRARNLALNDRSRGAELADPDRYTDRYLTYRPWRFAQNYTAMPDPGLVAEATADLYPQMGGHPIDGVMYLDPFAIRAVLEVTGPVRVAGLDDPLDADQALDFLVLGQYQTFPDVDERTDLLNNVAETAFDRLLRSELPGPRRLVNVFGPVARGGHLSFTTFEPDEQAFLEQVYLLQPFPRPEGRDVLAVIQANASPSKLDQFIGRDVHYEVDLDTVSGAVRGTVRLDLESAAPGEGLPEYVLGSTADDETPGTNTLFVSLYTPHQATAILDGVTMALEQEDEFGLQRWGFFLQIPPGEVRTITYEVRGSVDIEEGRYRLVLPQQALLTPDRITVDLGFDGPLPQPEAVTVTDLRGRSTSGATVERHQGRVLVELTLDQDLVITIPFR